MNNNVFSLKLKSILALMVIVALIPMSGCDSEYYRGIESSEEDSGEGYKTITVVTDYYSFSFEYSTFYERWRPENLHPEWTIPATVVSLVAPKASREVVVPSGSDDIKIVTSQYIPGNISVYVYDLTADNSIEPLSATESLNETLEDWSRHDDFKLIERSQVMVSGMEAEYAEWELEWFSLSAKKSDEPPLEYNWQVLFSYEGLRWRIDAISFGPELREQIETDFKHVVKTFKILD
ncbi:hypothetical protein ACFLU1_02060 [Chloroflexota bacterium]